jgi:hypothetical protein
MWEHPKNRDGGKWVYVNAGGAERTHDIWVTTVWKWAALQMPLYWSGMGVVSCSKKSRSLGVAVDWRAAGAQW